MNHRGKIICTEKKTNKQTIDTGIIIKVGEALLHYYVQGDRSGRTNMQAEAY
jgi:hypothetical protein